MATYLYRLGRLAYRRRWAVLIAWLLALAVAVGASVAFSAEPEDSFSLPGTEAQETLDTLGERFPEASGGRGQVVFHAPDGQQLTTPEAREAIEQTTAAVGAVDGVIAVVDPFTGQSISPQGDIAFTQVNFALPAADLAESTLERVEEAAEPARAAGLTVEYGGDAFAPIAPPQIAGPGEIIGVAVAVVVLILVFRSVLAAVLPLFTALVGVGIGVMTLQSFSGVVTMDSTAPILALMLGLAVGIDYALFIVSRHQQQVRDGMDPEESAARANGTAGGAVVFAGSTVVIALAALAVVDIPFLTVMGVGAAGTVVVAVLIAITLLPAMFGFVGGRIANTPIPSPWARRAARAQAEGRKVPAGPAAAWVRGIARMPIVVILVGVVGLGAVALPATDLHLGLPSNADPGSSADRASELLDDGFGPGFNAPLLVAIGGEDPATVQTAAEGFFGTVSELPNVVMVAPPQPNASGDTVLLTVIPGSGPADAETEDVVEAIRDTAGSIEAETGTEIGVTGTTAMNIDISTQLAEALPIYCLVVVGLALLLLMLVFRSIAVPIKAAAGFLLSIAASIGAVVAVYQWGWLNDLFAVDETGPIISFLPILLVGVLFGLAMDYEVFLVSRMREDFVHGADPREAVATGYQHGAKVVGAAALIMIAVFGSFIYSHEHMIKAIAFSLAFGVLVDALLVRMTLVPALMTLMGRGAWWLPGFLQRALPNVDIEGERLAHLLDADGRGPGHGDGGEGHGGGGFGPGGDSGPDDPDAGGAHGRETVGSAAR
ncbi:MMPL family transporter [Allostreptomyces psammosilenae]|uniref:RND superfamily putative drug exporter n=1 Tax=Allostreptomyces psammosilenae TaxID=1892865 RepID=A0A853AC41_9ACTN|nr:MMPL family transporter [Allostreptomyces psammosilenae]NYI08141.1 RND superfamily putative drug exporter [Allostreptomyces psammosilenae]